MEGFIEKYGETMKTAYLIREAHVEPQHGGEKYGRPPCSPNYLFSDASASKPREELPLGENSAPGEVIAFNDALLL